MFFLSCWSSNSNNLVLGNLLLFATFYCLNIRFICASILFKEKVSQPFEFGFHLFDNP